MYHSSKGWYTSFMTESFHHEDTSSERVQLEDGQVEVFFDGVLENQTSSIILDVAKTRNVTDDTPYGVFEYEELLLANGETLTPSDMSLEEQVMEFGCSLEPVIRMTSTALLRTTKYRRDMQFLDIIRNVSTAPERKEVRLNILEDEKERIPLSLAEHKDLIHQNNGIEFWLRLEAANNPDKDLVGKVIMARLALLMSHERQVAIVPMIYSAVDGVSTRIPEQLVLHEDWLYVGNI